MRKPRYEVIAIAVMALAVCGVTLRADVKTQEKTQFKLGGGLGKVVSMFGGKAAREGVVSTVALKGDRRSRTTDTRQEIVDLAEEKVYQVDLDDKSYTVVTFAELRKKMEEAQREAKERASHREKSEQPAKEAKEGQEPQVDIDFDVKETGEKKTISGFETRQVIMTVTVRQKGKTLEEAGGTVLTADTWLGPEMPEMKEIAAFELRYAQKLYGGLLTTESMQQMATVLAANPHLKDAMARFQKEKVNMQGTPISTIITMDGVQSKEQMAQESKRAESDDSSSGGGGGLLGGFARKMAKRRGEDKEKEGAAAGPQNRATVFTTTTEVLKIERSASAADVSVPAGFKEKK